MGTKFWKEIRKSQLLDLLNKGESPEEISKKIGICKRSYYYYLSEVMNKYPTEKAVVSIESIITNIDFVIEELIKTYKESPKTTKPRVLNQLLMAINSKERTLKKLGIIPQNIDIKIIQEKEE